MKKAILLIGVFALLSCSSGGGGNSPQLPPPGPPPAEAATDIFLKDIAITQRTATSLSGVASVSCLSIESVMGGGAYCSGNVANHEAGFLFSSNPTSTGFIASCYPMEYQLNTPITVYAVCAVGLYANAIVPSALVMPEKSQAVIDEENRLLQMIEDYKATMN